MAGVRLLVVFHSRGGATIALRDALLEGARHESIEGVEVVVRDVTDATPDDVLTADGIALVTPERFGSMAGLVKDFFERVYYEVIDQSGSPHRPGLPYILVVKGGYDGQGTVTSVEKIATGLRWRRVLDPAVVTGHPTEQHLEAIAELGATFAAGLGERIF
jgi:multimeric flavodoxin WrbA